MIILHLEGVKVHFPFPPYKSQETLMAAIIRTLNESYLKKFTKSPYAEPCSFNALLESPTGTGKTLCLLCACLAWRIHFIERTGGRVQPPRIYLASRTHSQITNAIAELKKSPYTAKISILSSREHLCVHDDLAGMKGSELNRECNIKRTRGQCSFYENLVITKEQNASKLQTDMKSEVVQDIEDLFKNGKEMGYCPYYYERYILEQAEIIFLPYNYIISPSVRESTKIDLYKSIVIFDEAHNLPQVLEEAMSIDISMRLILQCIVELSHTLDIQKSEEFSSIDIKNTVDLRQTLLDLEFEVESNKDYNPYQNCHKSGLWIYTLLNKHGINRNTYTFTCDILSKSSQILWNRSKPTVALQKLSQILKLLFASKEKDDIIFESFRVQITENDPFTTTDYFDPYIEIRNQETERQLPRILRTLQVRCLNPAIGIQSLLSSGNQPPQCIILASGTLSPLNFFAHELGLPFPPRLRVENPHVIKDNQLSVFVCGSSVNGISLSSEYSQRSGKSYHEEVGLSLIEIAKIVPSGLLVFFSSYSVMNYCASTWMESGLFKQIETIKSVFIEPASSKELKKLISDYEECIKTNPKGAIMFAVCRGKVSEGLSFANDNGRCVVLVGLPFPPKEDPTIIMKQQVLDALKSKDPGKHTLSGRDWYMQQCSQALNQSIGRVIRHKNDYATVVLLDERFSQVQQRSNLSFWLQRHIRLPKTFQNMLNDMRFFYNDAKSIPRKVEDDLVDQSQQKLSIKDARVIVSKQMNTLPKISGEFISSDNGIEPNLSSNLRKAREQSKLQGANFVKAVKLNLSGRDFIKFRDIIRSFEKKTPEEKVSAAKELRTIFISHPELLEGLKPFIGEYAQYLHGTKRKIQEALTGSSKSRRIDYSIEKGLSNNPILIDDEEVLPTLEISQKVQPSKSILENPTSTTIPPPTPTIPIVTPCSPNSINVAGEESQNNFGKIWKCPICFDSKDETWSAPCGHVCCNECWKSLLQYKCECPVCKQKVREKQLRKVYIQ